MALCDEGRGAPGPAAGLRTGKQFLADIARDGRRVVYDGELVPDVTTHAAFRGAARSIARLWDIAADPAQRATMTCESPSTGRPVLRCYQVPASIADLADRRAMTERWSEDTFGLMGRTPDHVAGFFAGFAARPRFFAAGGSHFAENLLRFHAHARDNHLYLAYALVPPQIDRSRPAHQQSDPTLYAGVVAERDDGIVLQGAQQLATGAVFANVLFLSCIHPLAPGDEAHAISAVIPMNAPGLTLYPRRSYATAASSEADYPLSSRFDETDSLVTLNRVFVPWEHVFVYRDIVLCRDQWHQTPAHAYGNHQAQARYAVKLRFLMGVMHRHAEITGVGRLPHARALLGEMAALATIVEAMVRAQEAEATVDAEGVVWPSRTALYAIMALQAEINPRLIDAARELSGGAMLMTPSAMRDLGLPAAAEDLARHVASPGFPAPRRLALLRIAWDLIGSEFAGRHQQYEKFYGGPSLVNKLHMHGHYDFARSGRLVDDALSRTASA